uniref:C-type lectin domain-containing protein n=1 Tax=Maylandia zebra TaxID=106582 RepID=A0A3P9CRD5_9CICH
MLPNRAHFIHNVVNPSPLCIHDLNPGCSCYLLSESSASWDAARKNCRDRGADLMVVDTPKEQVLCLSAAWIGLTDEEQEGTWKWVDGTPLTLMYWAGDQPDNGGGSSYWGEEDCVHVRTDTKKTWNDRSCSTSLKWICEKNP